MHKSVAVIGAGPAGLYLAEVLAKKLAGVQVDIIERLPTPFGLVRGGVAPDHQGTKNIVRQFERTLQRDNVRFHGNVEVGRDVSYLELKQAYDAVVFATGALRDHRLGIPGETLPGVYGSGAFVGWYNGLPDFRDLAPELPGSAVAIIGNGNVALDLVRILAKSEAELTSSDLCAHARAVLFSARLTDIYLIGRRGPLEATFTPESLAELGALGCAVPLVDSARIPDAAAGPDPKEQKIKEQNLELLRGFAANRPEAKPLRIHLLFQAAPVSVLGTERVEGLRLEHTRLEGGRAESTGETFELPVSTVITAIGYRSAAIPGLPFDERQGRVVSTGGRVEPGVYATGWCRRGPQGVIPANRADALGVAELVLEDLAGQPAGDRPGRQALERLLAERGVEPVSFADWQIINAAESGRAEPGRPREKYTRVEEMLALLGRERTSARAG